MYCNKCGNLIQANQQYCNKCGNYVGVVNKTPSFSLKQAFISKAKDQKFIIGIVIGLFTLVLIVFLFGTFNNSFFFSNNSYQEQSGTTTATNTSTSGVKSKYTTAVITDRTYTGVSLTTSEDVYKLIVEDSVSQKDNCPKEIQQVENDMISKYNITAVNLCEMDVNFAKELEGVYDKIYTEFPSTKGYLTNVNLVNIPDSEDGKYVIAYFKPIFEFAWNEDATEAPFGIKTQIALNARYFLNEKKLEASAKSGSEEGHFPPNSTKYSPVAHEMGHYLSFIALLKHYNDSGVLLIKNHDDYNLLYDVMVDFGTNKFSLQMLNEAYDNYKKDTNTTLDFDSWRATVSKYAVTKDNSGKYIYDETIAESFHDVYLNGDNAVPASKYIIAVLKKYLGN